MSPRLQCLGTMTNEQIDLRLKTLFSQSRKIDKEVLDHINTIARRQAHLAWGYPTLFEWLTKGHGLSESTAYRRIESARLLSSIPELGQKIESGEVSLATLAAARRAFKAQEKATATKIPVSTKAKIIENIQGKSSFEAEQILVSIFPEIGPAMIRDKKIAIDLATTRLHINISNDALADLDRLKSVLAHVVPNGEYGKIIAHIAKYFRKHKDPNIKWGVDVDSNSEKAV